MFLTIPQLQFEPVEHVYTHEGRIVPSVTTILQSAGITPDYSGVPAHILNHARDRGIAVHRMIELDLADDLHEESLHDELRPYFRAWRKLRVAARIEKILCEQRVYSRKWGYAGTLDSYVSIDRKPSLLDIKATAQFPQSTGPQTAGYEIAFRESAEGSDIVIPKVLPRYALHIKPERAELIPLTNPNDARVFLSCLTVHQFKESYA